MRYQGYRYQFTFNAMHNLDMNNPKKMHAHSFRVNAYIGIEEYRFEQLQHCENTIKDYLKQYEGIRLNELRIFQKRIPSIENICAVLYRDIKQMVAADELVLTKLEFGDSPLATYAISEGKNMLIGSVNNKVSETDYAEYCAYIKRHYQL